MHPSQNQSVNPSKRKLLPYLIWFLASIFMFYKNVVEVSPGVMAGDLILTFNLDGFGLGNMTAFYFYAYLLMQIPAGLLVDRFGPRRVTTIAIILASFGLLIFSLATTASVACLSKFITGLGAAFAAISGMKLISNWFCSAKFSLMLGLLVMIAMIGAIFGQAPLSILIEDFGWRHTSEILFVAGVFLAFFFYLVVRDKPIHHKDEEVFSGEGVFKSLKTILKDPQAWWISLYSGVAYAPITLFGGLWGVPFFQAYYGFPKEIAAHAVSFLFFGFAAGGPLTGLLAGKWNNKKGIMLIGTSIALALSFLILYCPIPSTTLLCLIVFLFGMALSSFLLCFSVIRLITPPIVAATAIGFMNAFDAGLGAISSPLSGALLDFISGGAAGGSFSVVAFQTALSVIPIYLGLGIVFLLLTREPKEKV